MVRTSSTPATGGSHVGFYGGIDYGFGYVGEGYYGGRWAGDRFEYNTAVNNVNVNIVHNSYNQTIVNNVNIVGGAPTNRLSYAGGPGTRLTPNAAEIAAAREAHVPPTGEQVQHQMMARGNPELAARRNEGRPPIATVRAPGAGAPGLARQQQLEHENFARQPVHDHAAFENLEQQHWQQTSRMVQQHQQQSRQFFRAPPARRATTAALENRCYGPRNDRQSNGGSDGFDVLGYGWTIDRIGESLEAPAFSDGWLGSLSWCKPRNPRRKGIHGMRRRDPQSSDWATDSACICGEAAQLPLTGS